MPVRPRPKLVDGRLLSRRIRPVVAQLDVERQNPRLVELLHLHGAHEGDHVKGRVIAVARPIKDLSGPMICEGLEYIWAAPNTALAPALRPRVRRAGASVSSVLARKAIAVPE